MKTLGRLACLALILTGCAYQPPQSTLSIEQSASRDIDADATAVLDVVNTAPLVSFDSPDDTNLTYDLDQAADDLRRRLYFRLVDDGHLKRVVDPGQPADLTMKVTITEFELEPPPAGNPNQRDPKKDGKSEMTTMVVLADQASDETVFRYSVATQKSSGSSPIDAEQMLDEATVGIIDGLRQVTGSQASITN